MGQHQPHLAAFRSASPIGRYSVRLWPDWDGALCDTTTAATPFQSGDWLAAWYATPTAATGFAPVVIEARSRATNERALLLPLTLRRLGSTLALEFADADVSDYNAPLLGPAAPADAQGAEELWRAILSVLPPADIVHFRKMPLAIEGRPNPLALLRAVRPCPLNGNVVAIADTFAAYHFGLEKTVRKELERSWRVFEKASGARFVEITDHTEALAVLAAMEEQQRERMAAAAKPYLLDRPESLAFYRDLITRGLGHDVILTALLAGETVVGALLGIRRGKNYVMIRISNRGGEWSNCSPGRLVIHRTMALLHERGIREFDFTIGNYPYKRRFQPEALPLVDLIQTLTWRGIPLNAKARLAHQLRAYPGLDRWLRSAMGKPPGDNSALAATPDGSARDQPRLALQRPR